jgi:hypothetical protein
MPTAMIEDRLFEIIDPVLRAAGAVVEEGEEYRTPPLDVLRYYRRPVRLHWAPLLGRASSVVAVVRQPVDVGFRPEDYRTFLTRLTMAVNGRFPPWTWPGRRPRSGSPLRSGAAGGLVIGLSALILTPEPIGPDDDAILGQVLAGFSAVRTRTRAVPMGLLRLNLGQEALAFALAPGPDRLFPEPEDLADALSLHFRRFVPLMDV